MTEGAPTIFESFNARALNPVQVAQTFVPSRQFDRLTKRRHSLIVGPRGSGKTTLLKMLQQPALEAWDHDLATKIRDKIDFTAVFVPTDIGWQEQVLALGARTLDDPTHRLLGVSTFTTHVLRSVVAALLNRISSEKVANPFRRVSLSQPDEASLVKELCHHWYVSGCIPTLLSLRQALSERLSRIFELASKEALLGLRGRTDRLAAVHYLHLHFFRAAAYGIEMFDDIINQQGSKWALCFDELELAPDWIQEELVRSLRSTHEQVLFKLALNPYTDNNAIVETAKSAQPAQDFDPIPLWYAEKRDSVEFCSNLWLEMLRERKIKARPPLKVLGNSYFETPHSELRMHGGAYAPGSRIATRFVELAAKDELFRTYLNKNALDPAQLHKLPENVRAAKVRKVAPVVAVREFYRRGDVAGLPPGATRSRKTAELYSGAETLFAITEGNPRWFIGIVDRLLDNVDPENPRIEPWRQADEVWDAAERFEAMLRTIPVPNVETGDLGVLGFVRDAAEYFHDVIVRGDFRPEPPATFVVDQAVPDDVLSSLGLALNAGAIVYVPDSGRLILRDLRSKRFRVSYLLAPIYGLALRLGKEVALSTILGKRKGDDKPAQRNDAQLRLLPGRKDR